MTALVASQLKVSFEPAHRRWLLVNAALIPLVANAILNGGIAWLTSLGERTVPLVSLPLVQKPSTITDTLGTIFILPFITGLLVTVSVRRDQRAGNLPSLDLSLRLRQAMAHLPKNLPRRAAAFGVVCLGFIGSLAALVLTLSGFGDITESSFVLYKVILGVCVGLVVTPIIAVVAMADRI